MSIRDYHFDDLPRSVQIVSFFVIVVCLAFAFYFYFLKDAIAERDGIQVEIERLNVSVAQGTAIESRLKRFRQELAQLEEHLARLQSILPTEKETPAVLRSVQQMAAASNLKIDKFVPQPTVPRAFYADWPIQIDLSGNYDGLGTFFEKISQAARIINVDSITFTGLDKDMNPSHTLNANCIATTFVYRADQGTAAEESNPGVKR
jgi:type IV pilus assembly protein PilO